MAGPPTFSLSMASSPKHSKVWQHRPELNYKSAATSLTHNTHLIYAVHHEIGWFLEYSRPELKSGPAISAGPPHQCLSSRCTILEVVFRPDTTSVSKKFTLDVGVAIGAEIPAAIGAREGRRRPSRRVLQLVWDEVERVSEIFHTK